MKFVFATTEPEKVIATIRSRTHHYPFRLVPPGELHGVPRHDLRAGGRHRRPRRHLAGRARRRRLGPRLAVRARPADRRGAATTGISYEYAAGLLGYTDASLLDDTVDAFAAGDAAAVFRIVDRVVEAGHDPRRFAEDLLERLRDLIILDAVPDAAGGDPRRPPGRRARADAPAGRPLRRRPAVPRRRHRQRSA